MSATGIRVRKQGAAVRITLDGDPQRNAVTPATLDTMCDALATAAGDEDVRVVVLAGEGRAFCAGADLTRLPDDPAVIMTAASRAIRRIADVPIPVIASVHGPAAGFGVSLVAAADVSVAGASATFSLPFAHLGLMPDGGLTHLLATHIGRAAAAELVYSGRRVGAEEAAATGLVSRVVADAELDGSVDELVSHLAEVPRRALTLTKGALHASGRAHLDRALDLEAAGQAELLDHLDRTSLAAFRTR
ncbi:MAG TPA: enoyl-CoA hydratase-related protein [Nocardioides sp.]|nr:enoyl-CoA hydratase-related protein [Nocardioides sp.]